MIAFGSWNHFGPALGMEDVDGMLVTTRAAPSASDLEQYCRCDYFE